MKRALAWLAAMVLCGVAEGQPCQQQWLREFVGAEVDGDIVAAAAAPDGGVVFAGMNRAGTVESAVATWGTNGFGALGTRIFGTVRTVSYLDPDGAGPQPTRLYVGGSFSITGMGSATVARWTGTAWEKVGTLGSAVHSTAVFDDGGGPSLFAGTSSGLFEWNGTQWSAVGPPIGGTVLALAVYDEDGPGPLAPALFVGGPQFVSGSPVKGIVRWDGTSFTQLGLGVGPASAQALHVADLDGPGPEPEALYVGGAFQTAGGNPAGGIAKWDGSSWTALGTGVSGSVGSFSASVLALTSVDEDGSGPLPTSLIVAGAFTSAGGQPASCSARWRAGNWSAIQGGFDAPVRGLVRVDSTGGPRVYACGHFSWPGPRAATLGEAGWRPLGNAPNGRVFALATVDLGDGPELWAGGSFTSVAGGAVPAGRVAAWTGEQWRPLGGGVDGEVQALAAFDDGAGVHAYAGGSFQTTGGLPAPGVALWRGSVWGGLGGGVTGWVRCAAVFDEDGSGPQPPALFIGGTFTAAGGRQMVHLARWNGESFSPVGDGLSGFPFSGPGVYDMLVWDDGSGPALYVAGAFLRVGPGLEACSIAKWDGQAWSTLAGGTGTANLGYITTLAVFNDGSGEALYAGGAFSGLGGVPTGPVARWDGAAWSSVGPTDWGNAPFVSDLVGYDDGSGPALHAVGRFGRIGADTIRGIGAWRGGAWSQVGGGLESGNDTIGAAAVYDDGTGPALYIAGNFLSVGSVDARRAARWDGVSWSQLGLGLDGEAYALAVYDGGGGPVLYAGGAFRNFPGFVSQGIARWTGSGWESAGSVGGGQEAVYGLTAVSLGGQSVLVVGGEFTAAGIRSANRIARWTGQYWEPLGVGAGGVVYALCAHDDGSGPALYAGGSFDSIGGIPANRIAKWDGSAWTPLGVGTNAVVYALCSFDDGSGPALYAGGYFQTAGGLASPGIARWKGGQWQSVGSGVSGGNGVNAMAVFTDGSSTALYVGGSFTNVNSGAGGPYLARWSGTAWSALPGPIFGSQVKSLATLEDVTGAKLIVGGNFTRIGAATMNYIAGWDGLAWSPLGTGMSGSTFLGVVDALAAFQDGTGPAVFAGGAFVVAGGVSSQYLGRWGCVGGDLFPDCYANCDGSTATPALNVNDFQCFINRYAQGSTYANCDRSTVAPVLNVNDFLCFVNAFSAGCR